MSKLNKNNLPERKPLNLDEVYLSNLVEHAEEELVDMRVQEWVYQREVADPKHVSKTQATEYLGIYQKKIRYLCERIEILHQYAEFKDIKIY